jgi:cytochrome c5
MYGINPLPILTPCGGSPSIGESQVSIIKQSLSATLATILLSVPVQAADMSAEAIKERIAPVGGVYLEGDLPDVMTTAAEPATASGPRDGASVYQSSCFACHGTGASGAPIKGNAEQWGPRLAQGMDTLLSHALNGFNAMPPKGTCMNCSDEEIEAAIRYMTDGL